MIESFGNDRFPRQVPGYSMYLNDVNCRINLVTLAVEQEVGIGQTLLAGYLASLISFIRLVDELSRQWLSQHVAFCQVRGY